MVNFEEGEHETNRREMERKKKKNITIHDK